MTIRTKPMASAKHSARNGLIGCVLACAGAFLVPVASAAAGTASTTGRGGLVQQPAHRAAPTTRLARLMVPSALAPVKTGKRNRPRANPPAHITWEVTSKW